LDKQNDGRTVDARFDLTAYYVSSEKLQQKQAAASPKGQPAQNPPVAK